MAWKDSTKCIEIRPDGSRRVYTINTEDSRTQQQFKEQCDVNNIIAKYKTTGQIMHVNRRQGVYADVSKITDYHTMVLQVKEAQDAFGTLPSEIRLRFANDPGQLLDFMADPRNYDEGVKLGLYEPRKAHQEAKNDDLNDDKRPKVKPKQKVVKETQLDLDASSEA